MNAIIIRLRNREDVAESKNILISMLEELLRNEDTNSKKKKLEAKYNYKMTVEKEEVNNYMCNLSDILIEKGSAEGEAAGIIKGEWNMLFKLVSDGLLSSKEAAKQVSLTEDEFIRKLNEWKDIVR